jgi:hypothetical protein
MEPIMAVATRLGLLTLLFVVTGCGPQQRAATPTTHKVEGKIVQRNGAPYTGGGLISFQHQTQHGVTCNGLIKPDGSFALHSITADHKVPGALEGTYVVSVLPDSQSQDVQAVRLSKTYAVQPGGNDLTITLE